MGTRQTGLIGLSGLLAAFLSGPVAAPAAPSFHGFLDGRAGVRTQPDDHEKDVSLAEIRAQVLAEQSAGDMLLTLRADFLYDGVPRDFDEDLESGEGPVDLREANVQLPAGSLGDIKAGRQILTWGLGDMLFINDLFPKDWQSFFSGRDTDYLKAPSDAILLSMYPADWNLDVVYTPRFDADRFVSGDRLSYWNPQLGSTAGKNAVIDPEKRDTWFTDDEWAARLRRTFGGMEAALYGYAGYWKTPEGMDPVSGNAYYPELSVYGASLRTPVGGGLLSLETGYYDSREDRDGTDPYVPNRQQRGLVGYERELVRDLQLGLQYYAEVMLDYNAYRDTLPDGMHARDQVRQVATVRLTRLAMSQNLTVSLFGYFSPTDQDAYLRPYAAYKVNDNLMLAAGANVFMGQDSDTFFGQFEDNNNVYAAVRYSF
jgi:hypothetical protein